MTPDRRSLPFDTQVRLAVYDHFLDTGRPPSPSEIAVSVSASQEDVRAALSRLHDAHMLVIHPESGEIIMANPFSGVPTAFRVEVGDRVWWANCIWDSFGLAAMLNADTRIETSCPCCGDALSIEVQNGALVKGEGIIHFAIPAKHWWDNIIFT